jgi:uncharacterized protein YlxW (UPF0749 family)
MARLIVAGLMIVVSVFAWSLAGGAPKSIADEHQQTDSDQESAKLKSTVETLEKKVAELEARIQALETKPTSVAAVPKTMPAQNSLPQGWQRREFGDVDFFIVPLGRNRTDTKQR